MSASQAGIPQGARFTPVPDLLFSSALPTISDPAALKLLLEILWRVHRRERGSPPAIRRDHLWNEASLRRGLSIMGVAPPDISKSLDKALKDLADAGWVLVMRVAGELGPEEWLSINGPEGRALAEGLERDDRLLPSLPSAGLPAPSGDRPNVFRLYEENIGMLSPLIAEELKDASERYPEDWFEAAIELAVSNNARKWSYVRAILERWARDGRSQDKDDGHAEHRRRDQATAGQNRGQSGTRRQGQTPFVER